MAVLSWVPGADTHPPLPLTQGSEGYGYAPPSLGTRGHSQHVGPLRTCSPTVGSRAWAPSLHTVPTPSAQTPRKGFSHQKLPTWSVAGRREGIRCLPRPESTPSECASQRYRRDSQVRGGGPVLCLAGELAAHEMKLEQMNNKQTP